MTQMGEEHRQDSADCVQIAFRAAHVEELELSVLHGVTTATESTVFHTERSHPQGASSHLAAIHS